MNRAMTMAARMLAVRGGTSALPEQNGAALERAGLAQRHVLHNPLRSVWTLTEEGWQAVRESSRG